MLRPTLIERAFVLANSGRIASMKELRKVLKAEGYPEEGHLYGRFIRGQPQKLMADASGPSRMER
jgi:hypothetical protein